MLVKEELSDKVVEVRRVNGGVMSHIVIIIVISKCYFS